MASDVNSGVLESRINDLRMVLGSISVQREFAKRPMIEGHSPAVEGDGFGPQAPLADSDPKRAVLTLRAVPRAKEAGRRGRETGMEEGGGWVSVKFVVTRGVFLVEAFLLRGCPTCH